MLFYPSIYEQIDEYVSYKATRYPLKAGACKALLYRLARCNDGPRYLTVDMIAYFVGEELSPYFRGEALTAIRGFIRYARMAGYTDISPYDLMESRLGRPRNERRIKEVRELRSQNLSYTKVLKTLSERYKKRFHKTQIVRWARYPQV